MILKIIFFFIINLFYYSSILAQDNANLPHVIWVKQFPEIEADNTDSKLSDKITDFILGKRNEQFLSKPISLVASNIDSIYILDSGNSMLYEICENITELKEKKNNNSNNFISLVGICKNSTNKFFFTDSKLNKVFKYNYLEKTLTTLNDTLTLNQPTGIAFSEVNNYIWITETASHQITIIDENGKFIKQFGKRGNGNSEFNFPTNLCIDKHGNAYVLDALNFRVQIFNKNGDFISQFGSAGDASGYFARPKGIAIDTFGNIYITDALFHVVQIFDKSGNFLYRFGAQGHEKEQFWMPSGLYIDSNNYIYVADSYNSRIQIFKLVNGG